MTSPHAHTRQRIFINTETTIKVDHELSTESKYMTFGQFKRSFMMGTAHFDEIQKDLGEYAACDYMGFKIKLR